MKGSSPITLDLCAAMKNVDSSLTGTHFAAPPKATELRRAFRALAAEVSTKHVLGISVGEMSLIQGGPKNQL